MLGLFREVCTVIVARMSHWKWIETKQQPSRARSGHQISCCLVSLRFLCNILATITIVIIGVVRGQEVLLLTSAIRALFVFFSFSPLLLSHPSVRPIMYSPFLVQNSRTFPSTSSHCSTYFTYARLVSQSVLTRGFLPHTAQQKCRPSVAPRDDRPCANPIQGRERWLP